MRRSDLRFSEEIGHLENDASASKERMLVATLLMTFLKCQAASFLSNYRWTLYL